MKLPAKIVKWYSRPHELRRDDILVRVSDPLTMELIEYVVRDCAAAVEDFHNHYKGDANARIFKRYGLKP